MRVLTREKLCPRRCPGLSRVTLCNPQASASRVHGEVETATSQRPRASPMLSRKAGAGPALPSSAKGHRSPATVHVWGMRLALPKTKEQWPGESLSLPLVPFSSMTGQTSEHRPTPTHRPRDTAHLSPEPGPHSSFPAARRALSFVPGTLSGAQGTERVSPKG